MTRIKTSKKCSARILRWLYLILQCRFLMKLFLDQIETIFQRIPQGVNQINRLQLNNTNGCQNSVHPRDSSFRFINMLNNNASSNNNNIHQQSSNNIESHLQQSQSSESSMLRHMTPDQHYSSMNNDNIHRRSDYQTTPEGSTTPESSSESSAEEWESGELKDLFKIFPACH